MHRLNAAELKAYREAAEFCKLCGEKFTEKNPAVVDHDHKTGIIRGVLHRGCNAMLGVVENGRARYQLQDNARLGRMLRAVLGYISEYRADPVLYPTHRTDDEKRIRRNKKAVKKRAAAKAE